MGKLTRQARAAAAALEAANAAKIEEIKQELREHYLSYGPHILRLVEEWAAQFGITVSEFEMQTHGPSAHFTATTPDGEVLHLHARWDNHEGQGPMTLTVWLADIRPTIYLHRLKDFDRAFAWLDAQKRRRRGRRNR